MFTVYEIDYHGRSWKVGEADSLAKARKIGRSALAKSGHEFPVFIDDGEKVVADLR